MSREYALMRGECVASAASSSAERISAARRADASFASRARRRRGVSPTPRATRRAAEL